jgi:NAD(P)H-dependent FMN reductase
MKIAILSASARPERKSHRAALALTDKLNSKQDIEPILVDLGKYKFPPLEAIYVNSKEKPEGLDEVQQIFESCDGFIFVSPEYNGGYSGTLKNSIDYFKSEYFRKPIGVCSASAGAMGGVRAAHQMQLLVMALFGFPVPQMLMVPKVQEVFDEEGKYLDTGFEARVDKFVDSYLWLAEAVMLKKAKETTQE